MRELPRDLVTILRTEARNQRTPPIDYIIAGDGGRAVHQPDPDIAMAELLEEAATALAAKDAELSIQVEAKEHARRECERAEAQLACARAAAEAFLSALTTEPAAQEGRQPVAAWISRTDLKALASESKRVCYLSSHKARSLSTDYDTPLYIGPAEQAVTEAEDD